MPHDPELVAETRGWLWRAQRDLSSGALDLGVDQPLTGDAVFHAQHAAEKAMKSARPQLTGQSQCRSVQ
jgi:HEPN domain-containing protein